MRILLIAFLIIFVRCASIPRKDNKTTNENSISIDLTYVRQKDTWQVAYKLKQPVSGLMFLSHQGDRFRHSRWKVTTPNIEVEEIDEKEFVLPSNGLTSFQEFKAEFNSINEILGGYLYNAPFGNHGSLIFTGILNVAPLNCRPKVDCMSPPAENQLPVFPVAIQMKPTGSDKIVLMGQVFEKSLTYTLRDQGTFVYFGDLVPIVDPKVVIVVDPRLPTWMKTQARSLFPRIFSYYSEKTGHELPWRPTVFINFKPEDRKFSGSKGGSLKAVTQLSFVTGEKVKDNPRNRKDFAWFVAHEAAHFWNAQLYSPDDTEKGNSWMHEGGANAFASRALRDLKFTNSAQFLDDQVEALNYCILKLNGKALKDSGEDDGDFHNFYGCGSTIALLTELALKKLNPEGDLYSFWKALFEKAKLRKNLYSTSDYFDVMEKMGASLDLVKSLKSWILEANSNLQIIMKEEFNDVGLKVEAREQFPNSFGIHVAKQAIQHLIKQDCPKPIPVWRKNEGLLISGNETCQHFKEPFEVKLVNSHSVATDAARVYETVRERCKKSGDSVLTSVTGQKLKVDCKSPLPFLPAFIVFSFK